MTRACVMLTLYNNASLRRGIWRTIGNAGISPGVLFVLGVGMIAQAVGEMSEVDYLYPVASK